MQDKKTPPQPVTNNNLKTKLFLILEKLKNPTKNTENFKKSTNNT